MRTTRKQDKFIKRFEFALANFVFDGKKELATLWGPIVEAMQRGEFVWAVLLADNNEEIPKPLIEQMRKVFRVGRIS